MLFSFHSRQSLDPRVAQALRVVLRVVHESHRGQNVPSDLVRNVIVFNLHKRSLENDGGIKIDMERQAYFGIRTRGSRYLFCFWCLEEE